MSTQPLLIEIGCEELPPKWLSSLAGFFSIHVRDLLSENGIVTEEPVHFATPRRLALLFDAVPVQQPDKQIQRKGPALNAAYDKDGNPTKAALGFAQSCGVAFDALEKLSTPQGEWLVFNANQKGVETLSLLPDVITQALHKLPIAKRMRWGASTTEFVRPIHWVLGLLGEKIIPGEVFGITPARITYGHRFHHPDAIEIKHPDEYITALRNAKVEPDLKVRRDSIRNQVETKAREIGGIVDIDLMLLEEVAALVEWPVALVGQFDKQFLDVPHEALVSTMTGNQKYFPVFDAAGKLLPCFIFITNIESKDPQQIIAGNEKVIRPRFSDAQFFFEQDKKQSLESRLSSLEKMVFHPKLGTLADKGNRISALSEFIATSLNADKTLVKRAGFLCKADLTSQMVFEFPDLQGTMGYYYAINDGEPESIAIAIKEHYLPRFASDALPKTPLGQILALADRLDTLTGIFAIGQAPTGDKDPFALRRAALGILRILIIEKLSCSLSILVEKALSLYPDNVVKDRTALIFQIMDFLFERLRGFYQGIGTDITHIQRLEFFSAVRAALPTVTSPLDFDLRMHALSTFWDLPEAKLLATANKRASNILKQNTLSAYSINSVLLNEPVEKQLAQVIEKNKALVSSLIASHKYQDAFLALASLSDVVVAFFDRVMVMSDDEAIKNNRLSLLHELRALFLQIADISLIQVTHNTEI